MSIFKDTLKQYVQDQLKAREIVVSQGQWIDDPKNPGSKINSVTPYGNVPRSDAFLRYTTGKNSWVKMSSFVNFKGKIGRATYSGSQLARKYILEGGTLYESQPNKFFLREGVSRREGVYASDIDLGGDRPLGLRPMPGITSVQVNNKSAYGSLREATVKFYCWDKHQLEELELLYMRTGYSVLLEWGWSQYLQSGKTTVDQNNKSTYTNTLDNITIQNFNYPTIDIFYDNSILNPNGPFTSDEIIYNTIENITEKSNGNYDAMLGHIKNFSWQLMDNGGFECTTVLISRGEIISTLKLSSNNTSIVLNDKTDPNVPIPPLSEFEKIFLNYTALINNSELTSTWSSGTAIGQFATGSSLITSATATKLRDDINTKLGVSGSASNARVPLFTDDGNIFNKTMFDDLSKYYGITLLTAGQEDGVGIEYIKMDHFISLLNFYYNYKDKNNRTISNILVPSSNLCLASTDSVSVDPTTCLIFNDKALEIVALDPNGFTPKVFTSVESTNNKDVIYSNSNFTPPQFLTGSKKNVRGKISNIYVAIPKILSIYREISRNGDVNLIEFFKKLLNQISVALGGINDFSLHTVKSTAQIIDIKYLEQGSSPKYEFDLLGLKSVCRDVKITSRIFESQSSMIAIAAQSKINVGDLYTSTQAFFNTGLEDRILPEKDIYNDGNNSNFDSFYLSIYKNIIIISNYLKTKVIGDTINIGGETENRIGIIYPSPSEISNASSLLKTFHYQLRGDETSFKAIIPIELEITLDGIAGIVQGQIFKINSNILPSMYNQRNIGFIVTGITHSLQRNDWITVIKTQVCLLDAPDYEPVNFNKLRDIIQKLIQQGKTNAYLSLAIASYLTAITNKLIDYNYEEAKKFNSGRSAEARNNPSLIYIDDLTRGLQRTLFIDNGQGNTANLSDDLANFEKYLADWHKRNIDGRSAPLDTAQKRKDANYPENISDLKSYEDPSKPNSFIPFNTKLVDALVWNKDDISKATSKLAAQYQYDYIGRGSSTTGLPTLPSEANNALLCLPFPDLKDIIFYYIEIFVNKTIKATNKTEFEKAIKLFKKYNFIAAETTYTNSGKSTYLKFDGSKFYDYFVKILTEEILSIKNTKLAGSNVMYIVSSTDIAKARSFIDPPPVNATTNFSATALLLIDYAVPGVGDITNYINRL